MTIIAIKGDIISSLTMRDQQTAVQLCQPHGSVKRGKMNSIKY